MTIIFLCLAVMAEAYLLGGIDCGILVSKYLYHDDIRTHGSGNAGMTNMLRTFGKKAAALTALGDGAKGMLAVCIAKAVFSAYAFETGIAPLCGAYLAMMFAVIGHMKPIYFAFKGGKGVMVAAGSLLAADPLACVVLFVVFITVFHFSRMVSLGSVTIAVLLPVWTLIYGALVRRLTVQNLIVCTASTALMAFMVVYGHRTNIVRILNGTEYKFDGSHKK